MYNRAMAANNVRMAIPKRVFFSYSHEDQDLARSLADFLRSEGFVPWLAEDEIAIGDNVALRSGEALRDSDAMVVLLSPSTAKNPNIAFEIGYALGERRYARRVIPVLVRGADSGDMPWVLQHFRIVTEGPDWDRTCREVARVLRKAGQSAAV